MYAVVKAGGKQHKVTHNQVIKINKIAGTAGDKVTFKTVLAVNNGSKTTIGAPEIASAEVSGEIINQAKDKKVIVFKKKRRQNYRRKNGHRQQITLIRITGIKDEKGQELKAPEAEKDKNKEKTATSVEPEEQEATEPTAKDNPTDTDIDENAVKAEQQPKKTENSKKQQATNSENEKKAKKKED